MTWMEFFQALRGVYEFLISTLFMLTICLASGLLKFQIFREYFGLNNFFLQYEDWINICFFISAIYILLTISQGIYKKIKRLVLSHIAKKNVLKELVFLNEEEKEILEWLVSNNAKTTSGPLVHPALVSLVDKGILVRGSAGDMHAEWPHTINSFVWKKVKNDPHFKKDIVHK